MTRTAGRFSFGAAILLSTVLVFLLAGCAAPQEKPATSAPAAASMSGSDSSTSAETELYKIGIDDQLQVSVWRNADLSISVPVRPDGKISVPLVGDVRAGGLTPEEVASSIEERLRCTSRSRRLP